MRARVSAAEALTMTVEKQVFSEPPERALYVLMRVGDIPTLRTSRPNRRLYAFAFFPTAFFNVPKFWPSRQSGMVICSMPGSGGG